MIYALIFLIIIGIFLNSKSGNLLLKNVDYNRRVSSKVVEVGEEFEIETVIENKKMLPVTFLQVIESLPTSLQYKYSINTVEMSDRLYHKMTLMLLPYQRIKRVYKVFCDKRGKLTLNEVEFSAGDFLGFKTFNKQIERYQSIIVMPKSVDIDSSFIAYGDYNGEISVKRWIIDDPSMIVGVRQYTGYEPQNTIHWPSSLKAGNLMVKQFDYTSDNSAILLLNIESAKPFWINIKSEKIEKCISISRAICEKLEDEGVPYSFWSNGEASTLHGNDGVKIAGLGNNHFYSIMEILGEMSYGVSNTFELGLLEILKSNMNYSTYIIITPEVFEEYVNYINMLSKKCDKLVLFTLSEENLDKIDNSILIFKEN